jgi:membrane-bound lytic murein transglycosylase A
MIRDGVIDKTNLSLSSLIKFFKTNPHRVDNYVNRNPRFVFFDIQNSDPHGSINVPVTPLRTIATDKSIYPRAALAFISVVLPVPSGSSYRTQLQKTFVLDQDTGGAIRAPGRCDIYIGQGDLAGDRAGKTFQEGRLYYLFLK